MNTLDQMLADAQANNRMLTIGQLTEIVKTVSPKEYNSIIIDNAVAVKRYNYCYMNVFTQKIEYKSESRTSVVEPPLEQQIVNLIRQSGGPFVREDETRLVAQMEKAPKFSSDRLFSSTRKKVSEMVNGGRDVNHGYLTLNTDGDKLAAKQPTFIVRSECSVNDCTECKGLGVVPRTNKDGVVFQIECPECKGVRRIGTVSYFTPSIVEKKFDMVRCQEGSIENLKSVIIDNHKGIDPAPVRMVTHFNGIDREDFDEPILPFVDAIRDKTGENAAVIDVYYRIIPCFTFQYRNVLTSEVRTGVLVDPFREPELVLTLESTSRKIFSGVKDGMKNINRFFGSLGKSSGYKEKEDVRRSARLLIAVAVADGKVREEEKQLLTLTIQKMNDLTSGEQRDLLALLGSPDSSFLTDDDFKFHSQTAAEETLARMHEVTEVDGEVSDSEREIIERLRLSL